MSINKYPFFLFRGVAWRFDTSSVYLLSDVRDYVKSTIFWRLSRQEQIKERERRKARERCRVFIGGVMRTSVGRTLNVKPVLSFTRFKGLVTARNHAARVHAFLPSGIRWNARFFPFQT